MWQLTKWNTKSHHNYARIDVTTPEIHVAIRVFIGAPTGVSVWIT